MPPTRVGAAKLMDEDSRHRTRPVWNHSGSGSVRKGDWK